MGKISNLPASISRLSTTFEKGLYPVKSSTGPTAPSPGPTLLMQVSAALKLVSRS